MVVLRRRWSDYLSLQYDKGVFLFRQTSFRFESVDTRLTRVDRDPSNMDRIPRVITVQQWACLLASWYYSVCRGWLFLNPKLMTLVVLLEQPIQPRRRRQLLASLA